MNPIPAPGYVTISGTRKPPASWGSELHCQLRNGALDPYRKPWPVDTCVWKHDGGPGDIIAVRKV